MVPGNTTRETQTADGYMEGYRVEGYRMYKRGQMDPAFDYFVSRILAAICPTVTCFNKKKERHLISNIFTESDEAFALLILHNEFHRWYEDAERAEENRGRGVRHRKRKKFVDAISGETASWSKEGLALYNKLVIHVKELRNNANTGYQLEEAMRQMYAQNDDDRSRNEPLVINGGYQQVEVEYDPRVFDGIEENSTVEYNQNVFAGMNQRAEDLKITGL